MDPLMRKLFQPREAREKLRGMGGIMSSSPQLASTVAKFNVGGPIQAMAPERVDLGGAMPLASAIHGPSNMMYGQMSLQQLSALANSGDRLAAEVLMMLQPPAGARIAPQSVPDVARALEEFYPGSGYADVMRGGPRMPTELATTTITPAPLEEIQDNVSPSRRSGSRESFNLLAGIEDMFSGDTSSGRGAALDRAEQLRDLREGMTSGPGAGLDAITGDNLLPSMGAADVGAGRRGEETTRDDALAPQAAPRGTPVEPARNEASRKLLREERKAAPPAETPAPDLDFEDPSTFDTNFKTVMSRLEGVMGTGSKSSREDAMANLAMIGLAIAAGQSPDALTNIAQGALTGVQAIRAEKKDREEQEKALRMLGITTAMDMTAAGDAAAATAARDEVGFQRDLQKLQEESRLAAAREIAELQERARLGIGTGEGGRDPRAIEDFVQNVYTEALKAASGVARPDDMGESETPEAYAARKANTARQYMGQQFPGTYGGGGGEAAADPIMTRVQEALKEGVDPAKVRTDFTTAYPNLDPSAYGL